MEKRKILVIESRTFPASELNESLFSLEFMVTDVVSSNRKAFSSIEKNRPDLILTTLGGEEDIDHISTIESIHKVFNIPVIYVSKSQNTYLFHRAKKTNPVNYLFYPLPSKELEIALEFAFFNIV